MKNLILYALIIFAKTMNGQIGPSLLNNPNFTMVWNEEFNGNTLNTTRWTVHNEPLTWNFGLNFASSNVNNVKVENGWLKMNTTKNGNYIQYGYITCDIPSFDNAIYEVRAKFKDGSNASPTAWFWGGDSKCRSANNGEYQEIDILEYGNYHTSGGVHYCTCQCAAGNTICEDGLSLNNTSQCCPKTSDCRNYQTANNEYNLNTVEDIHSYFARWTYRADITMGQDYNILKRINTPSKMSQNFSNPAKQFVLWSSRPGCTGVWINGGQQGCNSDQASFPYWYHVDHVRIFTLIADCGNDVVEIPNFSTFVYGVKNTISLSNLTTIPTATPIYLYAQDNITLNNGFQVPTNADVTFGTIECR